METLGALSELGLGAPLLLLGEDRFSPVPKGSLAPGSWPRQGRDELGVWFCEATAAILCSGLPSWLREPTWLFLWRPSSCQESKFPRHPPPPSLSSLPQGRACSWHPSGGYSCPWAT